MKPTDMTALTGSAESITGLGMALGDTFKSLAGLTVPPTTMAALQTDYMRQASQLWNQAVGSLGATATGNAGEKPKLKDRRFAGQEWADNPAAAYVAQMYMLNARTLMELAENVQGDEKTKARVRFAVQQWIDAASPSNFLALNPEAQRKAIETKGQSIAQGLQLLFQDIGKGQVSITDESVFEVGRNVATTEGSVVFENDLFQLIEYKPLTDTVFERGMLFVPPCINKYYILDLQPDNSLIRWTVEQGHRVFVVSWRNPDQSVAGKTWDDYVEEGVLKAIDVVREITGQDKVNALGFCVGGTILTSALAVAAARGRQPAASLTLLTTLLDFSNTGVLDVFIDEAGVRMREMTIGKQSPRGPGLLPGKDLATTFSFLRPNDLVWNYVVGNYLKGEPPPPFDLLYWNGDATNLPGPMFCWYLRNTYLENNLKVPNKLTIAGEKVDLGKIQAPAFLYASREDHIVPWTSAYASVPLLKGKKRYVLGASGHIAGVINPPAKKKRSYWVNDELPDSPEAWLDNAKEQPGSWWTDWGNWLEPLGGERVPAPAEQGSAKYRPIEPAPGRYVKAKA